MELNLLENGFSNFEPWENKVNVIIAPGRSKAFLAATLEHTYQAEKTDDPTRKIQILLAATPGQARRMGNDREKTKIRAGWDKGLRISVMKLLTIRKFAEGSTWAKKLLATGDAILVEYNKHHDTFFGRCVCDLHKSEGKNMYGVLLMERRKELGGFDGSVSDNERDQE